MVTAAAGATLAVALVGFGARRFLRDVIAGAFVEWLVESFLVKVLAARLERSLLTEPLAYTLDDAAVRRHERTVVV